MGLGFIRKALNIATGGLFGLVFKDNSKKKRTEKASAKPASASQPKATTRKPQKARRAKPKARRTPAAKPTAGSENGTASEIERLAKLHGQGVLSDEEFAAAKAKILGTTPARSAPSSLAPAPPSRGPETYSSVATNVAAARDLADLAGRDRVTTLRSDLSG